MFKYIKNDLSKYRKTKFFLLALIYMYIKEPTFTAICNYRLSSFLYKYHVPILPGILKLINRILYGIEIGKTTKIGPGFRILHGYGLVIGERVEIGSNFSVNQGVTIGGNFDKYTQINEKKIYAPIIGDSVHVTSGAKILGPITIGNNIIIGANSVVTKSFGDNLVIAGNPAREIKKR